MTDQLATKLRLGLRLDLADALTCDTEDDPDVLKRVRLVPVKTGASDKDMPLTLGEVLQDVPQARLKLLANQHDSGSGQSARPDDEVAEGGVVADDPVQGVGWPASILRTSSTSAKVRPVA